MFFLNTLREAHCVVLTWQVCELVEELVLHAGELVVGVVRRGWRRPRLPLLFPRRPPKPHCGHVDQQHHCSEETKDGYELLDC